MNLRFLWLLITVSALPGCTYVRDVGRDFGQVFHLGAGVSDRAGFSLHWNALGAGSQTGYLHRSTYVGTDYHYAHRWHQWGAGILFGVQERWVRNKAPREERTEDPATRRGTRQDYYHGKLWVVEMTELDLRGNAITRPGRIEVGVHLLVLGLSAGVNVVEFADFVTGLFAWDILGDRVRPEEDLEQPPSSTVSQALDRLRPRREGFSERVPTEQLSCKT